MSTEDEEARRILDSDEAWSTDGSITVAAYARRLEAELDAARADAVAGRQRVGELGRHADELQARIAAARTHIAQAYEFPLHVRVNMLIGAALAALDGGTTPVPEFEPILTIAADEHLTARDGTIVYRGPGVLYERIDERGAGA